MAGGQAMLKEPAAAMAVIFFVPSAAHPDGLVPVGGRAVPELPFGVVAPGQHLSVRGGARACIRRAVAATTLDALGKLDLYRVSRFWLCVAELAVLVEPPGQAAGRGGGPRSRSCCRPRWR